MIQENKIFLPGGDKQLTYIEKNIKLDGKSILVIGASSDIIAIKLSQMSGSNIEMIVDDYETLLSSKFNLKQNGTVSVRLMEFDNTDFENETFDIVYSQGTISVLNRNKIIKEIKRILKSGGILCVGEMISLTVNPPPFMKNIWETAGLFPLHIDEIDNYYKERKFIIAGKKNLTNSLKDYYINSIKELNNTVLADNEKSYYKKIISKIKHEANAYLKLGGDKHIGFMVYLLRKE